MDRKNIWLRNSRASGTVPSASTTISSSGSGLAHTILAQIFLRSARLWVSYERSGESLNRGVFHSGHNENLWRLLMQFFRRVTNASWKAFYFLEGMVVIVGYYTPLMMLRGVAIMGMYAALGCVGYTIENGQIVRFRC